MTMKSAIPALYVTSRECRAGGATFYRGRLMHPIPGSRPQMVWQCRCRHDSRDEAEDCASAYSHCDVGSVAWEELQKRIADFDRRHGNYPPQGESRP